VSLNQPVRIAIVGTGVMGVGLSAGASRDWLIQQRVAEPVFGREHMNGGDLLRRSAT
jgi:hypothetical protein